MISKWLFEALKQFQTMPNALHQALLLTDGQNDESDEQQLQAALQRLYKRVKEFSNVTVGVWEQTGG